MTICILHRVRASSRSRWNRVLHAQYQRIARRRGKYKAAEAVAHSILVIASCLLRDREPYRDLGATYLDERDAARTERSHIHRLEQLGYSVALTPAARRRPDGDFRGNAPFLQALDFSTLQRLMSTSPSMA